MIVETIIAGLITFVIVFVLVWFSFD